MNTSGNIPNYLMLNAELGTLDAQGQIQLGKEREALHDYFINDINQNTVFFHNLKEKLDYLVTNDYYQAQTLELYAFEDIKALFKYAYSFSFRFKSFIGAYKFYTSYALKTNDGSRYLERFEDRVVANALQLAEGKVDLARDIIEVIITAQYQPATPTFSNTLRARSGSLISCFLLRMEDNMESIGRTITNAMQLSKLGGGVAILLSNIREMGAPIKGIHGRARGVVGPMKLLDQSFKYADQLGTRPGAGAVYINVHHMDLERAIDTKRENADESVRVQMLSLGLVVTDVFWQALAAGRKYYAFSTYDLERAYGKGLGDIDVDAMYEELVANKNISRRAIDPAAIIESMAQVAGEAGYPYIMNSKVVNDANPNGGWINMSNLCVTGDTRILTHQGYRNVKELYDTQEDFDVIVDKRARDLSVYKYGVSRESSTRMFKTAENAQIFKVILKNGMELRSTAWHKYYVNRGGELTKIPLTDVRIGDRLLLQSGMGAFGPINKPSLAYLAGALVADGTVVKNGDNLTARIDLYGDKQLYREKMEKALSSVLLDGEDLCQRQSTTTPKFTKNNHSNIDLSTISSAPLIKLFKEQGWDPSENKHTVPDFVKSGNFETQKAFIDGLLSLDAAVIYSKKNRYLGIELGSISKPLLLDIQLMLINMGVETAIYNGREAGTHLLPDGKGGFKAYDCNAMFSLRSSNNSREQLYGLVDWLPKHDVLWKQWITGRSKGSYFPSNRFLSEVDTIVEDGFEDVYDVTVANGNSVIFNGIATGQCSEILQENSASEINLDGSYRTIGEDISCNLGSVNVYELMNRGTFAKTVRVAVYALTAVSTQTRVEQVPSIMKGNDVNHSIGLGVMNLHGFFATEGIHYGSPESIEFTDYFFMLLNYHSLKASNEIARDRGETYRDFDRSTYHDGSYFDYYLSRPHTPELGQIRAIFERCNVEIPTREDWAQLRDDVMEHGLYHSYRLATAPTGSISYINHATSSIHPIAMRIEKRKEGLLGTLCALAPHMTNDNLEYFATAYELGPKATIDVYAAATPHVDQSLSLTLMYGDGTTSGDVKDGYIYSRIKEIKTVYYARVTKDEQEGTSFANCVACEV